MNAAVSNASTVTEVVTALSDYLLVQAAQTPGKTVPEDLLAVARYLNPESAAHPENPAGVTLSRRHFTPNQPVILTGGDDTSVTVLLPGEFSLTRDAAKAAMNVLTAEMTSRGWSTNDPDLILSISEPDYFLLHACATEGHTFHPELAEDGPATPDATLMTRVDMLRAPDVTLA